VGTVRLLLYTAKRTNTHNPQLRLGTRVQMGMKQADVPLVPTEPRTRHRRPVIAMETGYQRGARAKYKFAPIVGDGEWGIVSFCHISKRVRLCGTKEEATRRSAGNCGAVPCRGSHTVEHFDSAPLPQPVFVSKIWEDD
jgi:hypothetical protein